MTPFSDIRLLAFRQKPERLFRLIIAALQPQANRIVWTHNERLLQRTDHISRENTDGRFPTIAVRRARLSVAGSGNLREFRPNPS
jgi:hypothetical protein